jgi:hypothetical protein
MFGSAVGMDGKPVIFAPSSRRKPDALRGLWAGKFLLGSKRN